MHAEVNHHVFNHNNDNEKFKLDFFYKNNRSEPKHNKRATVLMCFAEND